MKFTDTITGHIHDESGAVTIDWVVLTSFVAGMGVAVTILLWEGIRQPTSGLTGLLGATIIETEFDTPDPIIDPDA
ncbi:MAG: hypothetical protein ACI8TF_002449 [Paracoccaceae bacterium]|jgi:hypothetical protein